MAKTIPRLLLFDIDGTLTKSCHLSAPGGSSLLEALSTSFGQSILKNGAIFSGGTDPSITEDLLTRNGISPLNCEHYQKNINHSFEILPGIVEKGIKEKRFSWSVLPNVNKLLQQLSTLSEVKLALLTGNLHDTAILKLKCAGVNTELFKVPNEEQLFGAFGSDHGNRSELVRIAQKRYAKFLGHSNISPNDMVIIGDSPRDIECAHANNVPCVAVDTGVSSAEELSQADDILVGGFSDIEKSIKVILTTKIKS